MIPFRKGSELDVSSNSEAVSSAESNSVEIERKFENFAASEPSKEKNNDDPFSDDEQDTISIDPDELVEIDQVLSSRIGDNGRLEFQILWKHDKVSDLITWCERDELSDCINIEVLDEFFEKGASRKRPSRNPKSQSTEIASPIKKRARAIPTKMNKGAVDKIKDASSEDDEDPFSNEEPEEEENGSQFSDDTSDESPFRAERELEDPITDTIERNVHLKSSSSDVLNSDRSPRQYQAHESAKTAASDSAIHHTPEIDYAGWGDLMSSSIPSPPKMKVVSQNVNKTSNSESSISLLSSPPLSSVQAGMSSSISFRIELPSKDVFEIELSQKLNPFPSLFVGTVGSKFEAKVAPLPVRNFLMDPKAGLAHYAFTIKDANESVSEQLRASAHFLLGILNSNGLRTLAATGVIYKWDQLESVGFESYMEMIEKRKKLHLVLDLDATLIWAVPHADIDEDTRKTGFRLRNEAYDMCVRFRPGVDRFLMEMGRYFEISIYTAAELRYAQELVEKANQRGWTMIKNELTDHIPWSEIIPTSRIISSGKEGAVGAELKNLQNTHLYYNRTKKWETVVIVDDNVNSWIPSNRHYIYPIQQFTGDPKDQYLTQCAEYLIRFYVDFFQRNSNNFSRTLSTL